MSYNKIDVTVRNKQRNLKGTIWHKDSKFNQSLREYSIKSDIKPRAYQNMNTYKTINAPTNPTNKKYYIPIPGGFLK